MKQKLEEAAKEAIHKHYNCNDTYPCSERKYCEHCNGNNTAFSCCECGADEFKDGFIAGAEWQAKQSPWISIVEQLPDEDQRVLVGFFYRYKYFDREAESRKYIDTLTYENGMWTNDSDISYLGKNVEKGDIKVICWMPIPSFDEILEANRDVLERIKEKGD